MNQDITTLLATIIGGLISAFGGFAANYYIQSTANKTQMKNETKALIERLYKSIEDIHVSCIKVNKSSSKEEIALIYVALGDIKLVSDLYFSSLKKERVNHSHAVTDYLKSVYEIESSKKEDQIDLLRTTKENFTTALVNLLKKKGCSL